MTRPDTAAGRGLLDTLRYVGHGAAWVRASEAVPLIEAEARESGIRIGVEGERRRQAEAAAPYREALERLARLIVSYADQTHRVVTEGGDPSEIADEWRKVVDEARTLLRPTHTHIGPDGERYYIGRPTMTDPTTAADRLYEWVVDEDDRANFERMLNEALAEAAAPYLRMKVEEARALLRREVGDE